jgi:hypothetical protein
MTASYVTPPNTLAWLLDPAAPGVRYLALRDLEGLPHNDPEPRRGAAAAHPPDRSRRCCRRCTLMDIG